jgi:cold shock CspA family protein
MENNYNKIVSGRIIKVSDKGWGFISSKDVEFTRIFFHWTALNQSTLSFKELKIGMLCRFVPIQVQGKGWRAIKIDIVEKSDVPVLQERRSLID